jgi:peroxiredoxin
MPLLQTVHQERGAQGLAVVGVAIDRADQVQSFVAESGVNYPILVGQDDAMQLAETLVPDFVALPLTMIVAPGGAILTIHLGELHPEDLRRIVAIADRLAQGKLSVPEARLQLENGLKGG